MLGGGDYHLDKHGLQKVRTAISSSLEDFSKIIDNKSFKDKFGEIKGDEHKRIPKEFQEAHEKQPLIAKKYFFYRTELDASLLLQSEFMDIVMDYFKVGATFNKFLKVALEN
jgi:hypothetical protein